MKATILSVVLLSASIALYSQPSRRGESERNATNRGSRNNSNNHVERNQSSNYQPSGEARARSREFEPSRNVAQVNRGETRNYQRNNESEARTRNSSFASNEINRERSIDRQNFGRGNNYRSFRESRPNNEFRESRGSHYYERDGRSNRIEFRRPGSRFEIIRHGHEYRSFSMEYRRSHFFYRNPFRDALIWSVSLSDRFRLFYPEVSYWRYPIGYRLASVPSYNADAYFGEVAMIYGKVVDSYFAEENDELYLYFGDSYPNQEFSIVIPGQEARNFGRNPEQYFNGQNVVVTGYVTRYENKPEILVRQASQVEIY